ncbi:MAG TPA: malate synthase A [Steroidobacteraceae bacterium]|jgi:malate synthase|nr:malate synthase A [Steroidobacteraceae bacterium]
MNSVLSERPGNLVPRFPPDAAASTALEIAPSRVERAHEVLSTDALALLTSLHRQFESRRLELLAARQLRQQAFDAGEWPDFLPTSADVRSDRWRIAPLPGDLLDRRVEIAAPPDRKAMINALNAPVQTFIADFEDACSPTWDNVLRGQINLADAVRRRISVADAGKVYQLNQHTATLIVRPRGWHLSEKHARVNGEPVSGALFDFALYLAGNHEALARRGTGPYLYLPKLESHLEARLWNDVFVAAQDRMGIPRGTIKATVLIETVPAAFEMDEILFELREHAAGLSCGRWDYIFSFIKKFRNRAECVLPDRSGLTMDRAPLKPYEDLLIQTCHRRGTHAIGGMAAQMIIRSEPTANAAAMERVRADKLREAEAGHDGSWIAYPALAAVARQAFDSVLSRRQSAGFNQLGVLRDEVRVTAADLLRVPDGAITEGGIRLNIRVGLQYLEAWLGGNGNVPLYHVLEDAATAEICRAQLWQWLRHGARTAEGWVLTPGRFHALLADELERIHREVGSARTLSGVFPSATRLFAGMVTDDCFDEFMTLPAYELLS